MVSRDMLLKSAGLWVVLLCLMAQYAPGGDVYVAISGDDANNGLSWSAPVKTIQQGVDLASEGDILWVSNGIYSTGGRVHNGRTLTNRVYIDKGLTLSAVNDGMVVVNGQNLSMGQSAVRCLYVNSEVSRVTISGISFANGGTHTTYDENCGGGAYIEGLTIFKNCVFTYCRAAYCGGALCGVNAANLKAYIFSSEIKSCSAMNGGGAAYAHFYASTTTVNTAYNMGGALYYCEAINSIINNNIAYTNGGATAFSGLYNCLVKGNESKYSIGAVAGGFVNGCTVVNNTASTPELCNGAAYAAATNSIFWNAEPCNMLDNMTGISYSCSPEGLTPTPENHCITSDPEFVNSAGGDFQLKATSPCVNAGLTSAALAQYDDLLFKPRVRNNTVDMGAYETEITVSDLSFLSLLLFD